jgi:lipoprotein-anchoring transpeptidase ErfK/SrfK
MEGGIGARWAAIKGDPAMPMLNRRAIMAGISATGTAFALGGCATTMPAPPIQSLAAPLEPSIPTPSADIYGEVTGEPFPIPAVKLTGLDPTYLRTTVRYPGTEEPGTIVVDPPRRYLYLVEAGGSALRYGVGVGREGFGWAGTATIHDKQEWPDWYPPKEMIQRQPELRTALSELQSGLGMHGGPRNPLGARAMYLWQCNKDTLYRIHGTVEPWTIGKSVSSGCIRMINQDVIDLYRRAPVSTRVVVTPSHIA